MKMSTRKGMFKMKDKTIWKIAKASALLSILALVNSFVPFGGLIAYGVVFAFFYREL